MGKHIDEVSGCTVETNDGWISLNDQYPPNLLEVMFFYTIDEHKKDIVCGHYDKGCWHICYLYSSVPLNNEVKVTHWRYLPEFPE